jgi:hypothetical protein
VRIAPDLRLVMVGSPRDFAAHSRPATPQELEQHDCMALRLPTQSGLPGWEFSRGSRTVVSHVSGRLVFPRAPTEGAHSKALTG